MPELVQRPFTEPIRIDNPETLQFEAHTGDKFNVRGYEQGAAEQRSPGAIKSQEQQESLSPAPQPLAEQETVKERNASNALIVQENSYNVEDLRSQTQADDLAG